MLRTTFTLTVFSAVCLHHPYLLAAETEPEMKIDTISVTATRIARSTKDVPEAISVIDQDFIENSRMFNIADALAGVPGVNISSQNNAYDAKIVIRGGGLKANYGVREIFLLRDGVPITDPDSFTRLDFIDMQDVERIEVSKGPGNIYATGSSAGVIQILTKSPFDPGDNSITVALGNEGQQNLHARYHIGDDNNAWLFSYSETRDDNDWRDHNEFESQNISVKYGHRFRDDSEFIMELAYNEANLDLPGSLTEQQFSDYLQTGKTSDNNSFFKTSGRYSETWFFNSRLITHLTDNLRFQPRIYYSQWRQDHPVTPFIVENGWVKNLGTDLEFVWEQAIGSLVFGATLRNETNNDAKSFEYADWNSNFDYNLDPGEGTLTQQKGALAKTSTSENDVLGFFAQQSIDYFDRWIIDLSVRYDEISVEQDTSTFSSFNFPYASDFVPPQTAYNSIDERVELDDTFELMSTRIGISYLLTDALNIYANVARGDQIPFTSELEENPSLTPSETTSYEIGFKGRFERWEFDLAAYQMYVEDEIIAVAKNPFETSFQNAGKTDKKGVELSAESLVFSSQHWGDLTAGLNFTWTDYQFDSFDETYRNGAILVTESRDGNALPFVPEKQYAVHLTYTVIDGLTLRVQADGWGSYEVDNANSERYQGYDWLTSMNIAYQMTPRHRFSLNVQNISDKRYASDVKKPAGGDTNYTPGSPRSLLVSYRYSF